MRSQPRSWSTLSAILGFNRKRKPRSTVRANARKLSLEKFEDRRMLAVFTVTETYDAVVTGAGDALGTLRQAIFDAEDSANTAGQDTINFDADLDGKTITLGRDDSGMSLGFNASEADLNITEALIIEGVDLNGNSIAITIDASFGVNGTDDGIDNGNGSRIFDINIPTANTVTIEGLKLIGGDALSSGGAINFRGTGSGKLTIDNSFFEDN